jgi:hypothetical protein
MFPAMSSWTEWCYGSPTMLLYDHRHVIESSCGVQQGDPLGPLYFCCGIMCLVNEIDKLGPLYNKWYMDDGGIIGTAEQLQHAWDLIKSRGPELGLYLNPSKCEWSWLDSNCAKPCPIQISGVDDHEQVKLVPTREIQMLGVPLGDPEFIADYVNKKLFPRLLEVVSKLQEFEDSQAAMYLLRVSYSVVRAVHFMRTTPINHWRNQGARFDSVVRDTAELILGARMSDETYKQASLTPKLGGLGLRKIVDHAGFALSASWHESMETAREQWDRPFDVAVEAKSQKEASYEFDLQAHTSLVSSAPSDRERQRLLRLATPHCSGLVTAVPSSIDGSDTILRPQNYRIAVRYRLGLPVQKENTQCSMCEQTMDILGDHAGCCAKNADNITRHNSLRNLVHSIAAEGLLSPVMEKKGILGPTSGRRPGDVTIPIWSEGKGLCIDIAVTSPFTSGHIRQESPCETYAEKQKHHKYDSSFIGQNYDFAAMVFETTGAINAEGIWVLVQLFHFAAKMLGKEFSSFCGRSWARISCNLQRCVSQAIINRCAGLHAPPIRAVISPPAIPDFPRRAIINRCVGLHAPPIRAVISPPAIPDFPRRVV